MSIHRRTQSQSLVSVERESIMEIWGRAPNGDQKQTPWSGSRELRPLKLNAFLHYHKRGVGKFALKSVFCRTKNSVWRLGGHGSFGPLDPPVTGQGSTLKLNVFACAQPEGSSSSSSSSSYKFLVRLLQSEHRCITWVPYNNKNGRLTNLS